MQIKTTHRDNYVYLKIYQYCKNNKLQVYEH